MKNTYTIHGQSIFHDHYDRDVRTKLYRNDYTGNRVKYIFE